MVTLDLVFAPASDLSHNRAFPRHSMEVPLLLISILRNFFNEEILKLLERLLLLQEQRAASRNQ